jgi:hypothetical protein
MSELRLPTQMKVWIEGQYDGETVYLGDDNPQRDGTVVYRSPDKIIEIAIDPTHKASWP